MKNVLLLFLFFSFLFSCKTRDDVMRSQEREKELERVEKEKEVGKSAFAKLSGKYGIFDNKDATEYLNKLGKSLALYTERQDIEYFFAILNTDQVNAYALPGGYVLITMGALKRVENPGELIGIISHELGHINKKHILNRVKIEVSFNFFEVLARLIAGPMQIVTNLSNQINNSIEEALFMKGLDKEDEFEADNYSINLVQSLNLNAGQYMGYLKKLGEEKSDSLKNLDQTHPAISERISKIENILNKDLPIMRVSENFNKFKKIIQESELIK